MEKQLGNVNYITIETNWIPKLLIFYTHYIYHGREGHFARDIR